MESEIYITEAEQQEYLAYKSEINFFDNLQEGINALDSLSLSKDERNITLIAGAMVAFDKGTIHFINEFVKKDMDSRYILLSEVTAEFRRKTSMCIKFEYICTPHLLAKEIVVPYLDITITKQIREYVEQKQYLKDAMQNLEARHINMGSGYAKALVYYADLYLRKLLDTIKPQKVIMWNEFYAFHCILKSICEMQGIEIQYIEFGCIPGTIALEKYGQQGESFPARHPLRFKSLSITKADINLAKQVIDYVATEQLNRNVQPPWRNIKHSVIKYKMQGPVVTYMGQNDYESGMYPYNGKAKKFHSPVFESTLKALEFLSILAIKNEWNLIYKPHPIVESLEVEKEDRKQIKCSLALNVNIHELIDYSDVIVTILSQAAYVSLFRDTPVVLLGYMQLSRSGCVYDAYTKGKIESQIVKAIKKGYTQKQKRYFYEHVARQIKYCLYDDLTHSEFNFGKVLL